MYAIIGLIKFCTHLSSKMEFLSGYKLHSGGNFQLNSFILFRKDMLQIRRLFYIQYIHLAWY
jgi:hypothetical protein